MSRKPAYVDTQNFGLDDLFFADELIMTKPFPLHRHSFCELHLFRGGQGAEIIDGISYPVREGTMSLKMPWHVHELRPEPSSPLLISKCGFRLSILEKGGLMESVSAPLARSYLRSPVAKLTSLETNRAAASIAEMMEEQRGFYPLKEEVMAAIMSRLLILFLRKAEENAGEEKTSHDLLRLMNLRYREPELTCAKVAEAVHYSESQAGRLLEEAFGMSFGELLREIRIRNACGLLKNTDLPIESVALASGYTSRAGFYSAFTTDRGITPKEYRKRYSGVDGSESPRVLSSSLLYAKLVYYLHSHYTEEMTLEIASARFRYPEEHLKRVLKEQGTTFPKLLEEIRIYHARQLLLGTELNQEAIAREVGFSSPETFYRAFSRQIGCTPAEYRRSEMKEKHT